MPDLPAAPGSSLSATRAAGRPPTPVVLVHGIRTSGTMWRAQLEALTALGHDVRAVDLPGHGTRRDEPFTVEACHRVIDEAVESLGGHVLLVGLSLGGYLAISYTASFPDKVVGLVAAACCTSPQVPLRAAWAQLSRWIERSPGSGAGLNDLVVRTFLSEQAQQDIGAGGFALTVMSQALDAVGELDPLTELTRARCPVWIVNGQLDHFRTQERAFVGAARASGQSVRRVRIAGARHLVSLDAPVAFSRVLAEALDEVDGHG